MKTQKNIYVYILLFFVTVASFGQIINMNFYQDDNALIFKFTHLNERAGNLGLGIFGQGAYKYTLTPYLPIFHMFGYDPRPYYIFALMFIVISVYVTYIFFLDFLKDRIKAFLASFLYAAGYIGSDGLIRIFNSVLTSLSLIFASLTIYFYHLYYKKRQIKWYILSVLLYFGLVNIGVIRAHYFISLIIAFEVIFFLIKKFDSFSQFLTALGYSILRLIPFIILFYRFVYLELDARSNTGSEFLSGILRGDFYYTFSFFTSLGNMLLSNQVFPLFIGLIQHVFHFVLIPKYLIVFFGLSLALLISTFYRNKLLNFKFGALILFASVIILLLARKIFSVNQLLLDVNNAISLFTGIYFLILSFILIKILPNKKYSLFLLVWILANLIPYSLYLPLSPLKSDDRYLTHSFLPLAGLLALWSIELYKKFKGKLRLVPILVFFSLGFINLFSAVKWHSEIITQRSIPTERFFSELKNYYPVLFKNSLLYFYIPDKLNARLYYDANFGVGQMPDETAIAWRYNLDRYDLSIVNSFSDLKKQIKEKNIPIDHVYTFIADPEELVDTTQKTRYLLQKGSLREDKIDLDSDTNLNISPTETTFNIKPLDIDIKEAYSLTDIKLTLSIIAEPLSIDRLNFPIKNINASQQISDDTKDLAFKYRNWQQAFLKDSSISATDTWGEHEAKLAIDNNLETYWQGDRIKWQKGQSSITINLNQTTDIGGIVYRNGPSSLSPTKFEILVSVDGNSFQKVADVTKFYTDQISYNNPQIVNFNATMAKYIRLNFIQTSSNDSPAISEITVVPAEFNNIDYQKVNDFLLSPFSFVNSTDEWKKLMNNVESIGSVQFSWLTDGSSKFKSSPNSIFNLSYDGLYHNIDIRIPADGQYLKTVRILPLGIPGKVYLKNIKIENVPLN